MNTRWIYLYVIIIQMASLQRKSKSMKYTCKHSIFDTQTNLFLFMEIDPYEAKQNRGEKDNVKNFEALDAVDISRKSITISLFLSVGYLFSNIYVRYISEGSTFTGKYFPYLCQKVDNVYSNGANS